MFVLIVVVYKYWQLRIMLTMEALIERVDLSGLQEDLAVFEGSKKSILIEN